MRTSCSRFIVGFPLVSALWVAACGSGTGGSAGTPPGGGTNGNSSGSSSSNPTSSGGGGTPVIPFGGPGTSGQNNLIANGISPLSCGNTSAFNGATVTVVGGDNVTCYFSASVSQTLPLAFIEQDEETIGGKDLIHVRLTMNPAFVDNTYGSTAIGWSTKGTSTSTGMGMGMGMPMGMGHGHSFWDLIDSDHAEFDFRNSTGQIVLSFDLDYCSSDANSPSGFACLGVSGGDGGMLVGSASSVVYYNSSLARDLSACGYSSYTTNSPATDASYTPNSAAPNWDFRVVYDVWVLKSALPSVWSVSIPYVHASPSKLSDTYTVKAAPCPPLGCVGEGCRTGSGCIGAYCDGGTSSCVGEGCNPGGACVGLLCDGGSSTNCIGEACTDGGTNSWCSPAGAACTDSTACCSNACSESEGICVN
jgi:hypothetical protein